MANYKYNHFISKFYLKWFSFQKESNWKYNESCYYWDFLKNPTWDLSKKNISSPKKIGWENYIFNKLQFENWEKNYQPELEIFFSKQENNFSRLFKSIDDSLKCFKNKKDIENLYRLSLNDKELLCDFIRFQLYRSNAVSVNLHNKIENSINQILNSREIIDRFWINQINSLRNDKELTESLLHNSKLEIHKYFLKWDKLTNLLINRGWYLLYITKKNKSFITGDFPIYRLNSSWEPNWMAYESTEIIFPISSNVCLIIHWNKPESWKIIMKNNFYIKRINGMTLWNSRKIVVCNNLKLLKKMMHWKKNNSSNLYPANKR